MWWDILEVSPSTVPHPHGRKCTIDGIYDLCPVRRTQTTSLPVVRTHNRYSQEDIIHAPALGQDESNIYPHAEEDPCQADKEANHYI